MRSAEYGIGIPSGHPGHLTRNHAVRWGARGVPPAVFGVPPKSSPRGRDAPFGAWWVRRRPVGETPTGATGTVALPISTAWFRLNRNHSIQTGANRGNRDRNGRDRAIGTGAPGSPFGDFSARHPKGSVVLPCLCFLSLLLWATASFRLITPKTVVVVGAWRVKSITIKITSYDYEDPLVIVIVIAPAFLRSWRGGASAPV